MERLVDQTAEIEDSIDKIEVDPDLSRTIEGTLCEATQGGLGDKIVEGSIEMTGIGMMVAIEVGIDQERGHSQEVMLVTELEMQTTVGLGQDLELVLIRIE